LIDLDESGTPIWSRGNARHEGMVELAERMLDPSADSGQALHKQLPKAKTPHEQESLQRTIAATDKQIDELVYELYGLTEEEIETVEVRLRQ
jgi:hypothetical protein